MDPDLKITMLQTNFCFEKHVNGKVFKAKYQYTNENYNVVLSYHEKLARAVTR